MRDKKDKKDKKYKKDKINKKYKRDKENKKNNQRKREKNNRNEINYIEESESNIRKNKKKNKEEKKKMGKFKKFILYLLLIAVTVLGIFTGMSVYRWKTLAQEMTLNRNSIVKDIDGNDIAKIGCEQRKIPVKGIPDLLKHAYVSIEDERYYKHHGVDAKRTLSAIASYVIHFGSSSFGGSTITQQLVKNYTGDNEDSIKRKIIEWWKAFTLELFMDKDEILDAYLNVIYVGPNTYGVGAGAKYYFDKELKDLELEECAFLAGLNHSPNSYNPFGEKDRTEKIEKRTKTVLMKMEELGYITEEEQKLAGEKVEKGLKFKKGKVENENSIYSYHTDQLILDVVKDISEKYNISKEFANNYLNMAGLTIYSSQDSKIQEIVEREFNKKEYRIKSKDGKEHVQAAMVIINNETNEVVSCCGELGKKELARPFNRATQGVRQVGSAIKPIGVLIPALEERVINTGTVLIDEEKEFEKGYHPHDYNKPKGKINIREAIESSQNLPFVRIMEKLRPEKSIEYLEKMGVTTLTEKDNNLPIALGGLEKGISPLEMAGAYEAIANDGIYAKPSFYKYIRNNKRRIIIRKSTKKSRAFSKEIAFLVKDILREPVLGKEGTATYCKIKGMDVAAKTGTTDDNFDRWLCGFTPYYTATTWYGFDKNETIDSPRKQNPAGLIWERVMKEVHKDLTGKRFIRPTKGIKEEYICKDTGNKANEKCINTYKEYLTEDIELPICDLHSL